MLSQNGTHHNGHAKVTYLDCPSDYEQRPEPIDVTPKHRPSWRDQLAPVTWSMSYVDSSGISHSATLRGDTEEEVLAMVKPLVAGIRQAKQKASDANPTQPETQPERVMCKIHNVEMERRVSKRTGGHYFAHKLAGNDLCFGREKK